MRTLWTTAALVALALVTARAASGPTIFDGASGVPLLVWTGLAWVLFGAAWWGLRGLPRRPALMLVLLGTLAVSGAALAGPPNTSTDSARYAWDGIVAGSGVSPWAHAPADDALDPVREPWLFSAPTVDAGGVERCVGPRTTAVRSMPSGALLCTTLNRPAVPTIYPPVAQGWFAAVRALVPPTATWWPLQLAGAAVVVGVAVLLMWLLAAGGGDPRRAAWWGWCPFVASEAVTNSHVDVLGVALVVGATCLLARSVAERTPPSRSRAVLVGALIGLAAAVKVVPAIVAVPLVRRRPVPTLTGAVLALALVLVPALAVSGRDVIGYLPGYLDEQGYDSGAGLTLASLVVPGRWAVALSLVAIVAVVVLQWRHVGTGQPWTAQLLGAGAMLLVVSSPYPWYALVLVPWIALTARWEWFVVPLLMTAHLLVPDAAPMAAVVPASALVVLAVTWGRRRRGPGTPGRRAVAAARETVA
ncbi:glycosyltransferase 87 family protein [Terrabacter sp. NPDC000476]|uniref:glycosyltransferase 87 family protein n=1 Tax=Terrabacter sp. NPDC000476 TaxID=3154258 RepID=UPI0033310B6A